jgi:hypothetical protein
MSESGFVGAWQATQRGPLNFSFPEFDPARTDFTLQATNATNPQIKGLRKKKPISHPSPAGKITE